MIDITGVDLATFVKKAYDLSRPQGMGMMHHRPGPLSDEDAKTILDQGTQKIPVSMDYVRGRAVKMTVWKDDDGKLTIKDEWFDHSQRDLDELLKSVGITARAA